MKVERPVRPSIVPPHNLDAERSVIGSILLDPRGLARVRSLLTSDDFYWNNLGTIYAAAVAMFDAGEPIDNVTLAAKLQSLGALDRVGGRAELALMQGAVPIAANIGHYAAIIIEHAKRRALLDVARLASDLATDDTVTAEEATYRIQALLRSHASVGDMQGSSVTWPSPMLRFAFHGLAGDVVRRLEDSTEADPVALLLHLLVYFGHAVGTTAGVVVEETLHGSNEFVVLVGATSKARKGTAERRIRNLLRSVDEASANRIHSGLSSGEGLIWAVRDPIVRDGKTEDPGEPDKRLLVVENELATVLSRFKVEGSTLSPIMRDAWDRTPLSTLVSERTRSAAKARLHHISVVGHITQAELTRYFDRTEMANGLGNRFLWALVKRSRLLPRGGKAAAVNDLVMRIRRALEHAGTLKEIDFDARAEKAWNAVYPLLSADRPGLAGAMLARAEAHVLRLALIYCLLDGAAEIRIEHLLAALAIWTYCEDSVRCIFTTSLGDPDADAVLERLRAAGGGLTRQQLHDSFGRHWSSQRLDRALDGLVRYGAVEVSVVGTGGRPATRYRALSTSPMNSSVYVECAISVVSVERLQSDSGIEDADGLIGAREDGEDNHRNTFPTPSSPLSGQTTPSLLEFQASQRPHSTHAPSAANGSPPNPGSPPEGATPHG